MGKCLKLCMLALTCAMAFGCATKHSQHEDYSMRAEQRFRRSYEAAFDNNNQKSSQQLLRKARSAIGTPYVPGGMSPGGFDCSGFVCWAYKSVGVNLPRTAREQSVVGKRITNVEDMKVGDIVAFRHPRRGYHTGIYVGDGKFIHSPHRRTTVRVNSLDDPYFKGTFLGARRVKMDGTENLVAEAEQRLNDYAEEKAVRDLYRKHKSSSHSLAAAEENSKKHGKDRGRDKDKNRSKDKTPSKSRDNYVEVASLDKRHSSHKIDVQKADKASRKSSAKEDKQEKKHSAGAVGSASSKKESAKAVHKSESRKPEHAKSESGKSENRKKETAKSESKAGSSKAGTSKGESSKKEKAASGKVASKPANDKNKKAPAKNRNNNS